MTIVEYTDNKPDTVREVLKQLPKWFGDPEGLETYATASENETLLVCEIDGAVAGFLSLGSNTPATAEIRSMGVLTHHHRGGIGRALVTEAEHRARATGHVFLSVKTLSSKNPDPHYAKTRAFYEAVGFLPFEEFPLLWREDIPCLVLVKSL